MRPKEEETKVQTGTFILSEKIDDTKSKKNEKDIKKEMKRLEKEKQEREKREKKAREKEKEREKQAKKDHEAWDAAGPSTRPPVFPPLHGGNRIVPETNPTLSVADAPLASMLHEPGKVVCGACGGKCSGEVLRVSDKYFHTACFTCRACAASLARGGFFCKDGHYYCPQDYQRAFGTRCAACGQYVEGEVVSALGNTYHQKCFTCARCKRAFPSGEKVTYTGAEVVCSSCVAQPQRQTARAAPAPLGSPSPAPTPAPAPAPPADHPPQTNGNGEIDVSHADQNECAGCGRELAEGQALVALERAWHAGCFQCAACGAVLAGEYMGRGGAPYCERDYQRLFGVRCAYCARFIAGKVLQAGEHHHFHPTCARCTKCGDPFGDGEEMFLQGAAIWHPRCGPAPHTPSTQPPSERDRDRDRASADTQFSLRSRTPSVNGSYTSPYSSLTRKYGYRCVSPGLALREYRGAVSPHRITTYSYLTLEPSYLRRPLQPSDRPPASPHFHRPATAAGSRPASRPESRSSARPASGMRALVDSMRGETPRPRSPGPADEEPISLSHYPSAYKPPPGTQPKIERDDFPAPPYPYTDPERRRRWSDSFAGVPDSDEEVDGHDPRLRREEAELTKIQTGIAQVFLKEVKEREKLQQWKKQNLDPRNASRTPSASREVGRGLRYPSPVGASPSRHLDRARPLTDSESHQLSSYHGWGSPSAGPGGRAATLPAGAGARPVSLSPAVVSSLRAPPRPGYGLANRSNTFSSSTAGDFTFSGLADKTHSTDFSSGKSDMSAGSITDVDRSAMSGPCVGGVGTRRSLPNMATSLLLHEPAKLYPYHLLLISNYRLPPDVDRLNLERHLSDAEFEAILQVSRPEFYRLPQWRRNELKRRARLF